ncbi:MAG: GntR family transcriptional regulator [Ruminococcus sp.]|nr:GntR family transcriptional regulator [Ruminococcus sp.]
MFSLDLSSRSPIYEQLYNNTIRLISAGVLKPGDKLPPVRTLATELSVNPNTVSKAYKLLENDGYICSAVGKGSFVSPDLNSISAEKELAFKKLEEAVESATKIGITRKEIIKRVEDAFSGGKK